LEIWLGLGRARVGIKEYLFVDVKEYTRIILDNIKAKSEDPKPLGQIRHHQTKKGKIRLARKG
jgi:hypothetical protein